MNPVTERMGWTRVGLEVVQEEFARLRRQGPDGWSLGLKSETLRANTEEELLELFLQFCKKGVV